MPLKCGTDDHERNRNTYEPNPFLRLIARPNSAPIYTQRQPLESTVLYPGQRCEKNDPGRAGVSRIAIMTQTTWRRQRRRFIGRRLLTCQQNTRPPGPEEAPPSTDSRR